MVNENILEEIQLARLEEENRRLEEEQRRLEERARLLEEENQRLIAQCEQLEKILAEIQLKNMKRHRRQKLMKQITSLINFFFIMCFSFLLIIN